MEGEHEMETSWSVRGGREDPVQYVGGRLAVFIWSVCQDSSGEVTTPAAGGPPSLLWQGCDKGRLAGRNYGYLFIVQCHVKE